RHPRRGDRRRRRPSRPRTRHVARRHARSHGRFRSGVGSALEDLMRRPSQLRVAALLGAAAAVVFALLITLLASYLFGSSGRLGFADFNLIGLVEGALFIVAYSGALIYVRSALRLPSPTLLSFGL